MSPFHFSILFMALSISPLALPCDYTGDPEMQSQKANCISSSKEWNCQLNRCMTTAEALQTRQEFQQCQQLTDAQSKENCFLQLAEKKTGLKRDARSQKSGWETPFLGVSAGYALMGAISWASKKGGKCLSKKIMSGGSLAHLASHFLVLKESKKKFDSIAARSQTAGHDYNAQVQAFYLLREKQEAIKQYAKRKKRTYSIVAAAYGGALATAIMEKTGKFNFLTSCQPNAKTPSPSPSMFSKVKGSFVIDSSIKVATFSGIGMALAFKLRQTAQEEEYKSESNIKHIDKIIAQFKDSVAGFCPDGRENLKKPRCYCYTDKGEPHPQRTQSTICQNLWKQDNINYAVQANTYRKQEGGLVGCMDINGKFDPECQCRKYKNSATQENLCMKTSQNVVIPPPLKNNLSGVSTALKAVDVLTGASSNSARLNDQALEKAAARTKHYAEKLLKQYNRLAPQHQSPRIPLSPAYVDQAVKKLVDAKMQKRFGSGLAVTPLGAGGRNVSPALSQAIKTIDKNKPQSLSPQYQKKSSSKLSGKNKKKATYPVWPLDTSLPNTKGKVVKIENTPSPYQKTKNATVHINTEDSIWNIVSKRYLLSGIPLLFKKDE